MTYLDPCRFCGETQRLTFSERAFEELFWGVDDAGSVRRDNRGRPTCETSGENNDDGVSCEVCGAFVPLRVWNGSPDFLARMRANIHAADAEYDAQGVWRRGCPRLRTHNQKSTVAARAMADRKTVGHRS